MELQVQYNICPQVPEKIFLQGEKDGSGGKFLGSYVNGKK